MSTSFLKLFYHPHIFRLYEVIYTPTDIYMVMEFVPGGELFDFLCDRGALSELEAAAIASQVAAAVAHADRGHRLGARVAARARSTERGLELPLRRIELNEQLERSRCVDVQVCRHVPPMLRSGAASHPASR